MKKRKKEDPYSSDQKFLGIVGQSADAIFVTNAKGVIEYTNHSFEKLTGYKRLEAIGKTPRIIKSGMHDDKFYHDLWSRILSGKIFRGIVINRKKNGDLFYTDHTITPIKDHTGKINYFVGIWKDITKIKETRLEYLLKAGKILASSLDYKKTLDNIAKITVPYTADWCSVDLLDEKGILRNVSIMHKNPVMVGWAKRIFKTISWYMEAPQGPPNVIRTGESELYPLVTEDMLTPSVRNKVELAILKKIGFYSVMIVPLKVQRKTIGGITFVTTKQSRKRYTKMDLEVAERIAERASIAIENAILYQRAKKEIVQRLKAEKRAVQGQRELENIVRMKEDFLGIVSHELKTPVTSLKIYTQALSKQFEDGEQKNIIKFFEKMDIQIDRLTRLIRELLELSRIDAGKLELRKRKFNIVELAYDIIENFQATTRRHDLILRSCGVKEIFADEDRIRQVLVNLINNAIKYSPNGGKILITSKQQNKKISVSVKDYGVGIDKKEQRKIFDRFYQASNSMRTYDAGLGIGLYISNEIIKEHGGRITVRSKKGRGTTFTLHLSKDPL